jgi:hypothetical protein
MMLQREGASCAGSVASCAGSRARLIVCLPTCAQVDEDGHVVDFLQDPDGQKVRLTSVDCLDLLSTARLSASMIHLNEGAT